MSDYIAKMRALGKFPAVLRYERMGPEDLRRMMKHAKPEVRKNLRHVDAARIHLNHTAVGGLADLEGLFERTREMCEFNTQSKVIGLRKIGRPAEAEVTKIRGVGDPWDAKGLPWRQAILTINHEWAAAADDCPSEHRLDYLGSEGEIIRLDMRKCRELEKAMTEWLREEHGDALFYARWDYDEQGPHAHAAIAHAHEFEPSDRYAEGRWNWRPAVHPHFRNEVDNQGRKERSGYEQAQDSSKRRLRPIDTAGSGLRG